MSILKSAMLFLGAAQPVPDVTVLVASPDDMVVARTIAGEARGEDRFGQQLVADVIAERMKRRGMSAVAVCVEANQFAGSAYVGGVTDEQVELAQKLNRGEDVLPGYRFTHFYSGRFAPPWAEGKLSYKYGGHFFLRLD